MVGEFCEFEAEISARIVKTFSKAGKTERLARGSAGEQIDFSNVIFSNDFCHIAEVRHFRVMVGEHGSISLKNSAFQPSGAHARVAASTPEQTLPYRMGDGVVCPVRFGAAPADPVRLRTAPGAVNCVFIASFLVVIF